VLPILNQLGGAGEASNPNPPHQGQVLRDYSLKHADGKPFLLSDFRGKQNLVLIFIRGTSDPLSGPQAQLLQSLSEKSEEVQRQETRVIVVVGSEQLPTVLALSPALVTAVDDSGVMLDVAAVIGTTIYITDKFREVFHVYRVGEGEMLPTAKDILSWVEFVEMQCPECHPPEWPADSL
jgi:hypothetical protein